ncbi:MAG: toll/interleukin-1 receptor domain-containing protein [Ktedonobacterales bacterium]
MVRPNKIFISYRRDDSADVCARIYDWLTYRLPPENVFTNVDAVPFGVDFMKHAEAAIKQCNVMLLVIGSKWLTPSGGVSNSVRMEIELALQYNVKIVPVLVHDATMPTRTLLSPSIQPIVSLNANALHALDPYFQSDIERLLPDLGISKRLAIRGGSYWGISRPRYQGLSLFALAVCISVVMYSLVVVIELATNTGNSLDFHRWAALATLIFFAAGIPTLILFLVRTIDSRNWPWIGGFFLSIVPGAIAAAVDTIDSTHYRVLSVPAYLLALGIPAFLILSFAVFGPSTRARNIVLWALLLVMAFCVCWITWYLSL